MEATSRAQADALEKKYSLLAKRLAYLKRRTASGRGGIRRRIEVKRMDTLLPYFCGRPTGRGQWIAGEGQVQGLCGVVEARAFAFVPTMSPPDQFLHEWFAEPPNRTLLGNVLNAYETPDDIAYLLLEIYHLWHEPRHDLESEQVVSRTPLCQTWAHFSLFLPPERGTIKQLFQRAKVLGRPTPFPLPEPELMFR